MAAAASEKVTPKCLVSLACQGCGSTALDKTANTVDKVCQTIYCNQECLAKDTKHTLWCKKTTEETCSASYALIAAHTNPFLQQVINRRDELPPEARNAGMFSLILNGGEGGSIYTPDALEAEMTMDGGAPIPGLVERVKDLVSRFPITSHLVILSTKELSLASHQNAQFHLFKLDNPSDNPSPKDEKKDG